jgi:hypothetical protein
MASYASSEIQASASTLPRFLVESGGILLLSLEIMHPQDDGTRSRAVMRFFFDVRSDPVVVAGEIVASLTDLPLRIDERCIPMLAAFLTAQSFAPAVVIACGPVHEFGWESIILRQVPSSDEGEVPSSDEGGGLEGAGIVAGASPQSSGRSPSGGAESAAVDAASLPILSLEEGSTYGVRVDISSVPELGGADDATSTIVRDGGLVGHAASHDLDSADGFYGDQHYDEPQLSDAARNERQVGSDLFGEQRLPEPAMTEDVQPGASGGRPYRRQRPSHPGSVGLQSFVGSSEFGGSDSGRRESSMSQLSLSESVPPVAGGVVASSPRAPPGVSSTGSRSGSDGGGPSSLASLPIGIDGYAGGDYAEPGAGSAADAHGASVASAGRGSSAYYSDNVEQRDMRSPSPIFAPDQTPIDTPYESGAGDQQFASAARYPVLAEDHHRISEETGGTSFEQGITDGAIGVTGTIESEFYDGAEDVGRSRGPIMSSGNNGFCLPDEQPQMQGEFEMQPTAGSSNSEYNVGAGVTAVASSDFGDGYFGGLRSESGEPQRSSFASLGQEPFEGDKTTSRDEAFFSAPGSGAAGFLEQERPLSAFVQIEGDAPQFESTTGVDAALVETGQAGVEQPVDLSEAAPQYTPLADDAVLPVDLGDAAAACEDLYGSVESRRRAAQEDVDAGLNGGVLYTSHAVSPPFPLRSPYQASVAPTPARIAAITAEVSDWAAERTSGEAFLSPGSSSSAAEILVSPIDAGTLIRGTESSNGTVSN